MPCRLHACQSCRQDQDYRAVMPNLEEKNYDTMEGLLCHTEVNRQTASFVIVVILAQADPLVDVEFVDDILVFLFT